MENKAVSGCCLWVGVEGDTKQIVPSSEHAKGCVWRSSAELGSKQYEGKGGAREDAVW